ncbi:predicted protein [Scheffersomyces stipitis CBS 6054]|uniref:Sec20 C-terminal domain-containing protein n=1 Tax=Scheffersomyces stipitis (strain ATCC 58785 / CBS 6054 / NBRC 10063 / NRRL Y-11545) TaxID=322104 RepID=A3LTG8_PICST|nr:predicted protein [Scheffersomyces stipitis CBS 6054]ABN66403.2 predicted protein [Scheffersomyces stipitis CBS 6054]
MISHIDIFLKRLDSLSHDIHDNLSQLVQINQNESIDDAKYESSKVIRDINKQLLSYKEYLQILHNRLGHSKSDTAVYDQYHSNHKLNNEIIHKQRIERYSLDEKDTFPDSNSQESAREQLFAHRSKKIQEAKETSVNEQILKSNKSITTSLQTSRQLLSTSVLQSELNIDSLDQQTKDLRRLNEDFLKFNDLLARSRQIVKFIEKQDKSDRRRIYLSIGFFLLCCSWVVYKRILRTPLRLLLWSFFKIFRIFNWLFVSSDSLEKMGTEEILTAIMASSISTESIESIGTVIESSVTLETSETISDTILSMVSEVSDVVSSVVSFIESPVLTTTERLMDEL